MPKNVTAPSSTRQLIKTIYFYVFIGVGLILSCVGTYGLAQNIFNRFFLPKYPMGYNETRCDYLRYDASMIKPSPVDPTYPGPSAEELEKQHQECLSSLEEEREVKKATDLFNSIITLSIGLALFTGHVWINSKSKN